MSEAKGEYIDPSEGRKTVALFAEQWRVERVAPLKRSSQVAMETSWRTHVEERRGDRSVASIRQSEVARWIAEMQAERRDSAGVVTYRARSA